MDEIQQGLLGVQSTVVGLFLATFFDGVDPYPIVGLLLAALGTAIVLVAVFDL
jgi:uncharacterized membrane protein YeaQ/YmgE (transglycosylase-associated protein family)